MRTAGARRLTAFPGDPQSKQSPRSLDEVSEAQQASPGPTFKDGPGRLQPQVETDAAQGKERTEVGDPSAPFETVTKVPLVTLLKARNDDRYEPGE